MAEPSPATPPSREPPSSAVPRQPDSFQSGNRYLVQIRRCGDTCIVDVKLDRIGPLRRNRALILRAQDRSWQQLRAFRDGEPSDKGEDWVRLRYTDVPEDKALRFVICNASSLQPTK